MKKYIYILLVMLLMAPSVTVYAQDAVSAQKAEAQAQKDRAQLKRDREKLKKQQERDRARAKKEKEKAKKEATKQKIAQVKADEQARMDRWAADEAHKHQEIRAREAMLASNDSLTKEDRKRLMEEIRILRKNTDKTKYDKKNNIHSMNFWFGGGYSGLVNKYKNSEVTDYSSKFTGLAGGMVGLGYELKHQKFLFNIGPEFRLVNTTDKIFYNYDLAHPDYPAEITQHFKSLQATEKKSKENKPTMETNILGQGMLPIMFGGDFGNFYFLVGGKVGFTVLKWWDTKGHMTTSVTDSWAVDEWHNLQNHYDKTALMKEHELYAGKQNVVNNFGLDAAVSAEVGLNLDRFFKAEWRAINDSKPRPSHYKLSLFADYGVLNMNVYSGNATHLINPEGIIGAGSGRAQQISMTSLHQTDLAKDNRLNSLLVGLKFTAQVQFTKPKQPNPYMNIQLVDSFTHEPILKGGKISLHMVGDTRKPKMRGCKKNGVMHQRIATGEYDLQALAKDYLDGDPFIYDHFGEMRDTMVIALIPVPDLVVFVHNKVDSSLLEANVKFTSYMDTTVIEEVSSKDENKPLHMYLHFGDEYRVDLSAYDFHKDSAEVSYLYDTVHYYLRPCIHVKHKLVLKHMYFAFNEVTILPESEPEIQTLYKFLTDNPKIRVQITGHTDDIGSISYNQNLSEGRANSLVQEMIKRGIDPERMEAVGKGELEPIDTNKTAAGRQNNRRIEVIVLNGDEAGEDIL